MNDFLPALFVFVLFVLAPIAAFTPLFAVMRRDDRRRASLIRTRYINNNHNN